jgi:hypothetical protein
MLAISSKPIYAKNISATEDITAVNVEAGGRVK